MNPIVEIGLLCSPQRPAIEPADASKSEDTDPVFAQVFAVWNVLQRQGVNTMMGETALKTVDRKNKNLSEEMREKMKNESSWASFEDALDEGSEELDEAMPHFKIHDDPDDQLISVADARKMGILPIAFKGP
jgi:hypothetical protein